MANIQMNTQILKAITSDAYFTRVDDTKAMLEDKELMQMRPDLFKERLTKFDSPNNVKGIFITKSGIYVENYNSYATIDAKSNKHAKRVGSRIHFDKDVNKQWSDAVQEQLANGTALNTQISNNWMFQPVLQNLQYVYIDDVLCCLFGRTITDTGTAQYFLYEAVINAKGAKGVPTRQNFPRLRHLMYIPDLGKLFSSPNGIQNISKIQMAYKDNWGINLAAQLKVQYVDVDMDTIDGWGPQQKEVSGRPDIYLYDKIFFSDILDKQKVEREEAEQKRKEDEQKDKKEGYGIPGFLTVKKEFEDLIKDYLVNPVTQIYKQMLGIGFGGPKQNSGILTRESGWVYLGSNKDFVKPDRNKRIKAQDIWRALEFGLNNQGKQIQSINGERDVSGQKLAIPEMYRYFDSIAKVADSGKIIPINYGYNAKLIKGYVENCKLNVKYDEKVLNENGQKITSWTGVQFYIQKSLTDAVVAQLIKNKIVSVGDSNANEFEENNRVRQYCLYLRKAFCMGIYIQNQFQMDDSNELVQSSVRCCFPGDVNVVKLVQDFKTQIPNKVDVKIAQNESAVQGYSTLYFIVKYSDDDNKSMIPATKALEAIKESGELPSWSHALLGEKDDETPFYWNQFMSQSDNTPYKRAYSIYAGSRSGKGILTNTLLCNALANKYKIFYVDGKPDTGISLGHLAWKEGKEAFVFDGMRAGSGEHSPGMLEKYTHGLRSTNEWQEGFSQIPAGLQQYSELIQKVTTYYRCIELVFKLISYRAGEGKATVGPPESDWCIFVIDECAEMANQEKNLRGAFRDYVATSGAKKIAGTYIPFKPTNVKDAQKIVWNDELQFIRNWLDWMASIASQVSTAITMNLGPSQQNVFFIFQGSGWMQRAKETTMVSGLMQLPTTKILGRGQIEPGAQSQYGNATTSKFPWADYINKPLSWVITTKQSVNSCDKEEDVRKFKPYQLWGNTEAQMLEGASDTFRNIQFYVRELESLFGFQAADVLESAYNYADGYTSSHSGLNIKQYVYDLNFLTTSQDSGEREISQDELPIDLETGARQAFDASESDESSGLDGKGSGNKGSGNKGSGNSDKVQSNYDAVMSDYEAYINSLNPPKTVKEPEKFEQAKLINPGYTIKDNGMAVLNEKYGQTQVLNRENATKSGKSQGLFQKWMLSKVPGNPVGKDGFFQAVQYDLMIGDQILYEIQKVAGQSQRVVELILVSNKIKVNKKMLNFTDEMMNPQGEVDLVNCIKFKKLFKRFKRMQHLQIDEELYEELLTEYESYEEDRVKQVFKESKKLIDIKIIGRNGKCRVIQRGNAMRVPYKESGTYEVRKALRNDGRKTRDQMKNSGFLSRAIQLLKGIDEEAWGTPTKRALTSVTTIATVGFLGLAAGPLALVGWQFAANYMVRRLSGALKQK